MRLFPDGGRRIYSALLCALLLAAVLPSFGQKDPTPLYGPAGITYAAVRQGGLGSCYFHASIAALARSNPDLLRNAIRQTAPDSFVVTFASGAKETVDLEDVQYARDHDFDHSDGLWVAVLLRAYGQVTLRNALLASVAATDYPDALKQLVTGAIQQNNLVLNAYDRAIRATVEQSGSLDNAKLLGTLDAEMNRLGVPPLVRMQVSQFLGQQAFVSALARQVQANAELFGAYRAVGQGGLVRRVLEAFGSKVSTVGTDADPGDLKPALRRVHSGGASAVACSRNMGPANSAPSDPNWWVASHAYTVIDYDEASDSVTLRNPWAGHPGPDGVFQLHTADFLRGFEFMDFGTF
jgi:hypothetical protein